MLNSIHIPAGKQLSDFALCWREAVCFVSGQCQHMANWQGHTMGELWMLTSCHIMTHTTDWVVFLVCRSFSHSVKLGMGPGSLEFTLHGILQHVTGKLTGRPQETMIFIPKFHALSSKTGFKFGPQAHFKIWPDLGQNLAIFGRFCSKWPNFGYLHN